MKKSSAVPNPTPLLRELKDGIAQLVAQTLHDHRKAAVADAAAFLKKTQADLDRWGRGLAAGTLTPEDFAFLVKGKRDLAEMQALKQAGLALVRIDQFRNAVIDLVIETAIKMVPL